MPDCDGRSGIEARIFTCLRLAFALQVRPLALTHSTAWRLALAQPRTARSFRPALTSPLRRLSTPLASVRQPPPAPRPFCTDTGSMLKPRPPWGSGGGATGRVKHEEVKNAA